MQTKNRCDCNGLTESGAPNVPKSEPGYCAAIRVCGAGEVVIWLFNWLIFSSY